MALFCKMNLREYEAKVQNISMIDTSNFDSQLSKLLVDFDNIIKLKIFNELTRDPPDLSFSNFLRPS